MQFEIVSEVENIETIAVGNAIRELPRLKKYYGEGRLMNKSYVICINNQDYQASLELRKIYELISDEDAAKKGFVRVIDESGEDYLYPRSYFVAVDLPQSVQLALAQAS